MQSISSFFVKFKKNHRKEQSLDEDPFHINTLPREILIEVFRYMNQLTDRHNAMLVCKYWYEILQDPCFMHICPEILTIKYNHVSPESEFVQTFLRSSRQFNQICLDGLTWEDKNKKILMKFVYHIARNARIVFHNKNTPSSKRYFLLFPKMTELQIDSFETIKNCEEFPPEFNTVVARSVNPKEVDLTMPIFKQIKCLKSLKTFFKIVHEEEIETESILDLEEEVKIHLIKICDLKYVKIVTGSNLLKNEPLAFHEIIKLEITEPFLIKMENLSAFPKLQDFRVHYKKGVFDQEKVCKFSHDVFRCPSVTKLSFNLPHEWIPIDLCETCIETMLQSFPNLQRLSLDNSEYSNFTMLLTLIDKYCSSLRTLKLPQKPINWRTTIDLPGIDPELEILSNLEQIHLHDLELDCLCDWPLMLRLTTVKFIYVCFPEQISSWKNFVSNSPNIRELLIVSESDVPESIPSHCHIEEIVKGLQNLQELELCFNKLTPESLDPIFTYNRSLKNIVLGTMETPSPIFKLEQVFELYKKLPRLETFKLEFIDFVNDQYCEEFYTCLRCDYQSPYRHLKKFFHNYRDVRATIAYIRIFLMPHDKTYKGPIHSIKDRNVDDINKYFQDIVVDKVPYHFE